jgi:hypothetical protein
VLPDEVATSSFTEFVEGSELRLRQALMASFGPDVGRDAAAEAFAYGWEHWDTVSGMKNPIGYLYRVGQTSGQRDGRSFLPRIRSSEVGGRRRRIGGRIARSPCLVNRTWWIRSSLRGSGQITVDIVLNLDNLSLLSPFRQLLS